MLLTLIALRFSLSDALPRTGYMTLLDFYQLSCCSSVFFTTCQCIYLAARAERQLSYLNVDNQGGNDAVTWQNPSEWQDSQFHAFWACCLTWVAFSSFFLILLPLLRTHSVRYNFFYQEPSLTPSFHHASHTKVICVEMIDWWRSFDRFLWTSFLPKNLDAYLSEGLEAGEASFCAHFSKLLTAVGEASTVTFFEGYDTGRERIECALPHSAIRIRSLVRAPSLLPPPGDIWSRRSAAVLAHLLPTSKNYDWAILEFDSAASASLALVIFGELAKRRAAGNREEERDEGLLIQPRSSDSDKYEKCIADLTKFMEQLPSWVAEPVLAEYSFLIRPCRLWERLKCALWEQHARVKLPGKPFPAASGGLHRSLRRHNSARRAKPLFRRGGS